MHRPPALPSALLAAALLSLSAAAASSAIARPADAADEARAGREALGRGDGPAAVALLESALLAVPAAERPAVLDDLRRSYERAASQAEAAGDSRRARSYRENLLIIDRSRRPAGDAPADPPSKPMDPAPPPAEPPPLDPTPSAVEEASDRGGPGPAAVLSGLDGDRPPAAVPAPSPAPLDAPPPTDDAIAPVLNLPRADSGPPVAPEPTPAPIPGPSPSPIDSTAPPTATPTAAELLRSADAAFRAQDYDEAGRIYTAMAGGGRLPGSHRPVWAYCRFIAVARRINARPSTPAEWSAIHAEIREVRALAPEIWFSEYLRRLAAERSAAAGARPSAFIVRGQSEPDDPADSAESGTWQVLDTENFRILHADPALADRVARRAEQARSELIRYWTGSEAATPWSPRCDVYLYPDASIFARMTGQPADSPGFSTMGLSGGRVVARRINARADFGPLVDAVVPHEVTHVVLADLFPTRQIPRWADEGMAVLAEPDDSQAGRLAHLDGPLDSGRVFRTGALMTAAMPDGRYWDLFMAQSASLARYLIRLDTPSRFVAFLRESERVGPEPALRSVYGFDDFDDLHARWLSHARRGRAEALAARPEEAGRVR